MSTNSLIRPRLIRPRLIRAWLDEDRGVTSIEYAIIAAFIALAIIAGATGIGASLDSTFTALAAGFP